MLTEATDNFNSSQKLPDTCPTSQNDGLSQLSIVNTRNSSFTPWGRLNPVKPHFKFVELVKDEYRIGRSPTCDLTLGDELGQKINGFISKEHFVLKRVSVSPLNENDYAVHIIDTSFNGTFLNGKKLKRGNCAVLENNDEISLAFKDFIVFRYESGSVDSIIKKYPQEVRDLYAVSRILGSGACGVVRLVFEKSSGKPLAMKIIQKKRFNLQSCNSWESSRLQREANVLRALSNEFIIRFENVIDTLEHMFIVTEYVAGGELFDRVKKGITESQAKFYFYQLAQAIKYLHCQRIIHRDVKLENVLLSTNEPETLIKLSDFGYSKFMDPESVMNTICGTPLYIAPEILKSKGKTGTYDKRIDIWSMGVVLYICLSTTVPFSSETKGKTLAEQITEGCYYFPKPYWEHVSSKAKDLVKKMMTVDPKKRISIDEILKHSWLQERGLKARVDALLRDPLPEYKDAEDEDACYKAKRPKLEHSH